MAWIESHQSLRNHPKTLRTARLLGIPPVTVVGHLHYLWWWALEYAQDGDLTSYSAEDIALAADWDGDPAAFVDALLKCGPGNHPGFLERRDGRLLLHDWMDYAGKLIDAREHAAEQKRRHRELYNDKPLIAAIRRRDADICRYCGKSVDWRNRKGPDGATYDYVDPFGDTVLENVVVACRACNGGKGQRTPAQAGMRLLLPPIDNPQKSVDIQPPSTHTVPNRTVPNQPTVPVVPTAEATTAAIVNFWEQNGFGRMTPLTLDKLHAYIEDDGVMPDLILWALEECVKGGPDKCTYRYLQAILDRCRESKITARNQAEADRKHRAGQQVPSDPKKQAAEDAKLRKWMAEQGISENGVEVKPAG